MFQKIVAAVDGSECSMKAARLAGDVAEQFGGEVIVVHLAEMFAAWSVAVESETPTEAAELADAAVRELKDRGISARPEIRLCPRGAVAHSLVDIVEAEDADLLVMGSRGLGEVSGLLLGSITHRVLHLAKVPVLIAK